MLAVPCLLTAVTHGFANTQQFYTVKGAKLCGQRPERVPGQGTDKDGVPSARATAQQLSQGDGTQVPHKSHVLLSTTFISNQSFYES